MKIRFLTTLFIIFCCTINHAIINGNEMDQPTTSNAPQVLPPSLSDHERMQEMMKAFHRLQAERAQREAKTQQNRPNNPT